MILALALAVAAEGTPLDVVDAVRSGCERQAAEEIVVCGAGDRRSMYRLPEVSREYEKAPLRAEKMLGPGVQGSIGLQSVDLPGGHKSQRLMVTIGTKF